MSIIKKIKDQKNFVKQLLEQDPELRDSDRKLMAVIWNNHIHNPNQLSTFDFLHHLYVGDLPSYESITRARRKVQQENPHLQGKNYKGRKGEEADVRENIHSV